MVTPNKNCHHGNHVCSLSSALGSAIDFMLVYVTAAIREAEYCLIFPQGILSKCLPAGLSNGIGHDHG